jgi:hypothetical protein
MVVISFAAAIIPEEKENIMTTESPAPAPQRPIVKNVYRNASEAVYGLGFIGAAVYYIQHAPTFLIGAFGVLKAVVWPALVVYRVLDLWKF